MSSWPPLTHQDVQDKIDSYIGTTAPATYVAHVAYPTGVAATDNAAIQDAHDALPSGGGEIRLARSPINVAYKVTGLNFTKAVKVTGGGGGAPTGTSAAPTLTGGERLEMNSATGTALTIGADGCVLEDICVVNTSVSTPTAGAGISVTHGSHMKMRGVTVSGFWVNIDFTGTSGYYWTMSQCLILDPVKYGLWLRNVTPDGDWADPSITQTTFSNYTSRTPDAMIRWESGGGLRFVNNKVNTGPSDGGLAGKCQVGIDFAVPDGVTTGVFVVNGNSLENCTVAMIRMRQQGTTGDIAGIVLSGNEIAFGYNSCVGIDIAASSAVAAGHIRNIVIGDTQFANLPNGSIRLKNCTGVSVGECQHNSITGSPPIYVDTDVIDLRVAPQSYRLTLPAQVYQNNEEGTNLNPKGPFQLIDHTYSRALPTVSSTAAYVNIFSFDVSGYTGGLFTLDIVGGVTGVGSMARRLVRSYVRDGGNVTLATVGTDVAAGASGLDVQFDTTTTAGKVIIGVKLPSGSGGSDAAARATLTLSGVVYKVALL